MGSFFPWAGKSPPLEQSTYMFHSKVAHASDLDESLSNSVFDRSPALEPFCFASIWTVQQEQVDVSQCAFLQRFED